MIPLGEDSIQRRTNLAEYRLPWERYFGFGHHITEEFSGLAKPELIWSYWAKYGPFLLFTLHWVNKLFISDRDLSVVWGPEEVEAPGELEGSAVFSSTCYDSWITPKDTASLIFVWMTNFKYRFLFKVQSQWLTQTCFNLTDTNVYPLLMPAWTWFMSCMDGESVLIW